MPRGRTPKLPEQRRVVTLKVRVTQEEAEQFAMEADKRGLSLSAWMRFLMKQAIEAR